MKIEIFATTTRSIDSSLAEVENFVESNITTKTFRHETFLDVVLQHWDELRQMAQDKGLGITCESASTLKVEGMSDKVDELKGKLTEFVSRLEEAERKASQATAGKYIQNFIFFSVRILSTESFGLVVKPF